MGPVTYSIANATLCSVSYSIAYDISGYVGHHSACHVRFCNIQHTTVEHMQPVAILELYLFITSKIFVYKTKHFWFVYNLESHQLKRNCNYYTTFPFIRTLFTVKWFIPKFFDAKRCLSSLNSFMLVMWQKILIK